MLTADETRLVAHAYAIRHEEAGTDVWFAPALELRPDAHALVVRGYPNWRVHGTDLVYRLSDEATSAQELSGVTGGQCMN